jgi:hypothetical protein
MADEQRVRRARHDPPDDLVMRQRPELAVEQRHVMAASMRGPPMDNSPSGGSCSRGIRLPMDGCGGFRIRMRIVPPFGLVRHWRA